MTKIVFVCLGNICRSPTAEGVMLHLIKKKNLQNKLIVDSAGTYGAHVGERADPRSRETAQQKGFELPSRSRQFFRKDLALFDYIVAMDRSNYNDILQLAKTPEERSKVFLFRDFDPNSPPNSDVPDPYYGGKTGFEKVFDICFSGCDGLLKYLEENENI